MCLVALAWRAHPRFGLALIANRDEFHGRPTAAAGFDPEIPEVYGGRDLLAGGSWLLASSRGRLAAVTNVRVGGSPEAAPRSRGRLVRDFAAGSVPALRFGAGLEADAAAFGRFNLLAWDGRTLAFASNHPGFALAEVAPGLHAMSNGAFDAPWPKCGHATHALAQWLDSPGACGQIDAGALAPLFDALADTTPAPDAALPDTGIGLALERALSPPFVLGDRYGTRCSTIVLVAEDAIVFAERRFAAGGVALGDSLATLPLGRRPAAG